MKTQETTIVLDVRRVSKRFPGVQALKDVSISLLEGEVHALIGENGAGKSTLMNIIFGVLQPDGGEIFRNGRKVTIHRPIDAQKIGIGIVPQELNLVPLLSVMENITLGMPPCKVEGMVLDWKMIEIKAQQILEEIGEGIDPRAIIADLSTAQQQLVQIARALAFGAKILIFDEPTSSLTLQETETLFKIIRDFQRQGGAVFYISHRLEEIREIADRVTVLRDGCKVKELAVEATTIHEMIQHMVGRDVAEVTRTSLFDPTDKEKVLTVEHLSRAGEFQDVSFELYAGEILGLAGLVGAGRTELVKCLYGETSPDSGRIFLSSRQVSYKSPKDAINDSLAYVPEERRQLGIFPILSVTDNTTMPILKRLSRFFRIDKKRERAYVQEYVEKLNIKTAHIRQQIQNLSGGNQQKVILARWLLTGCHLLILDEPTRGIDVNAKAEIHQLLKKLVSEGISIIFISSELQEVIDIADRILIMHEGHLKGEVSAHQTNQEEVLRVALS